MLIAVLLLYGIAGFIFLMNFIQCIIILKYDSQSSGVLTVGVIFFVLGIMLSGGADKEAVDFYSTLFISIFIVPTVLMELIVSSVRSSRRAGDDNELRPTADSPAVNFVNALVLGMLKQGVKTVRIEESSLSELPLQEVGFSEGVERPPFQQIVNRLKVMSAEKYVAGKAVSVGHFKILLANETVEHKFKVECAKDDAFCQLTLVSE